MTEPAASVDFETFSEADLEEAGAYAYAQHPSTEILCMAWAIGDEEPELWRPGEPFPARLRMHVLRGGRVMAWNAAFERLIWRYVAVPRYGFPAVADEQFWCTAAQAANMALPRALDDAAAALGNAEQKDATGRRIMRQVSRPRTPTKHDPRTRWTPETAPDKFAALYAYCKQDVRVERGIASRLYALSPRERELYLLDQRINDRGIRMDRALVEAAKDVVNAELQRLDFELRQVTRGAVESTTQTARLTAWLSANGCPTDSVAEHAIEEMLRRPNLPWPVEKALLIRREAAKSSTAKLDAMLACAGPDDRMRGLLLYYGAARTGRWSGRLAQPHNYPRGTLTQAEVELAVRLILARDVQAIRLVLGSPLDVVSSCLRACLIAGEGCDLMAADFSNIEGRGLAWLAGETWKLDAFRAFDEGKGPDLYKVTYARSVNIPIEQVDKAGRQRGKVIELACGYQGWIGAFQTFARLYGLKIPDDEAAQLAGAWREAHPCTVRFWHDLNDAALKAVARPGVKYDAGPVTYLCANDVLWCRLPSGRVLSYVRPTIEPNDRGEDAVHFWTVPNPMKPYQRGTRKWAQVSGYGGLWAENVTQAVCRDVLAEAMLRLERCGYPVVLTVHDEIVCEVERGGPRPYSVADMEQIMAEPPSWAAGWPIAAAGWRGFRYRKD